MKKNSYNSKTEEELKTDLKNLRSSMYASMKSGPGKNSADYKKARKNIARVLTALNAFPKKSDSTEPEK